MLSAIWLVWLGLGTPFTTVGQMLGRCYAVTGQRQRWRQRRKIETDRDRSRQRQTGAGKGQTEAFLASSSFRIDALPVHCCPGFFFELKYSVFDAFH